MFGAIALFAVQAAAVAPQVPETLKVTTRARVLNASEIVTAADYPAQSLRRGEKGTTIIGLDLDENGRLKECDIWRSSGYPALDHQSCALYADRGRFSPARDESGKPVEATLQRSINWSTEGGGRVTDAAGPSANLTGLIRSDDYPEAALDAEEQGTVRALLKVDERGAVTGCTVAESSGSEALDSQTCKILTERARFFPAEDVQGRPVAGEFTQRIVWRLASGGMPWADWADRFIMRFSSKGELASCIHEYQGMKRVDRKDCMADAEQIMAMEAVPQDLHRSANLVYESRFVTRELAKPQWSLPGDHVLSRRVVTIAVEPDGTVSECRLIDSLGMGPPASALCATFRSFEMSEVEGEKAVPRVATAVFSVSLRSETVS